MKEKLQTIMVSFLQVFSTCWVIPTGQKMRAVRKKQNWSCSEIEKWDGEPRKVVLSSIEINCHRIGNSTSIYVKSLCSLSEDHLSYFSSWPSFFKHPPSSTELFSKIHLFFLAHSVQSGMTSEMDSHLPQKLTRAL